MMAGSGCASQAQGCCTKVHLAIGALHTVVLQKLLWRAGLEIQYFWSLVCHTPSRMWL